MVKQKKTALMKATDLLANQEQSSAILKKKLLAGKYDAAEIDDAIEKLKKYNYLDDEGTCRRQFENFYSEGKLSLRQIIARLIRRGFEKIFIEQLIPEDFEEHERLTAEKLLAKKFAHKKFDEIKARQFLFSRGFDVEIISVAVKNFQEDSRRIS